MAAIQIQARLAEGKTGILDEAGRVPAFRAAAERWLETHSQLGQLRLSTRALYAHTLRAYAFPRFGDKPVTAITREEIRTLVAEVLAKGRSVSLVRNVLAPIRQTFNQLIDDALVAVNPAARIGRYLKGKGDGRAKVEPLTPDEEALLLDAAVTYVPRFYPLFLCALRTGLRLGELFGLKWGDIDLSGRFIEVRRTLHEGGRVELPKNGKVRRVDMSLQLAEELHRLRVARTREAMTKGWGAVPDWVFCNEEGRPLWRSDFERRVFHRTLAKAGLRRIRFHDLRHTFASRLIQKRRVPRLREDQKGHHSIKVTVDVYGHLVPGANKAAVDRLDVTGRNPRATTNKSGVTACAVTPHEDLVELRGLEPLTPRLPALCSPN